MTEAFKVWMILCLALRLPTSWAQERCDVKSTPGLVPGTQVRETFATWKGPDSARLEVTAWEPSPGRPGGPLVAQKSWPHRVCGENATITLTSQFLGSHQEVLVTHLHPPGAVIMVVGRGMEPRDFEAILDGASYR